VLANSHQISRTHIFVLKIIAQLKIPQGPPSVCAMHAEKRRVLETICKDKSISAMLADDGAQVKLEFSEQ